MVENSQDPAAEGENAASAASAPPTPPARRPGHRGMDPRETLAELTAKAHEISQHAGTKVGAAMKDVIGAAAGLTGFAVESARDLIQYMVRRGQMTQTEGDKLLREVEAAHPTKRAATRSLEDSARMGSQRSQSPVSSSKAPAAKPAQKPASIPEPVPLKAAKAEAGPAKTVSKPETAATKEDRTSKSSKKPAAKKASAVQDAPVAKKPANAPADKPAAKKVTKAAAKKSPAKGSASRAAAPPRPRAAAKSAPVKRKK